MIFYLILIPTKTITRLKLVNWGLSHNRLSLLVDMKVLMVANDKMAGCFHNVASTPASTLIFITSQ